MHIDELRSRFGLTRYTIHKYVNTGIIPKPVGKGPAATYDPACVGLIAAYRALRDNNTIQRELVAHLREEGISVTEYVQRREQHIRDHGLGYA